MLQNPTYKATTTIILPLKSEKVDAVKKQLSSMHPEMLLFLSKIRKLSVREDNPDPKSSTVSEISISKTELQDKTEFLCPVSCVVI